MALSRLLDTTPPRLLTEAACGSLKPPPTRRLRRTFLHLSYSMTPSRLLDTTTLATGRLARPYPGRTFTGWTAPALAGAFAEACQKKTFRSFDRSRAPSVVKHHKLA